MRNSLFDAIARHELCFVEQCLLGGESPNQIQTEWPYFTALHASIEELEAGGSIEVLSTLIEYGADVNKWDGSDDSPPLLMAVYRDKLDAVKLLLSSGADPNVRGAEGDSPLRWSVNAGNLALANVLLKHGVDKTINEIGQPNGLTALGIAVKNLDEEMICLLLHFGARTDKANEDFLPAYRLIPALTEDNKELRKKILKILFGTKKNNQ